MVVLVGGRPALTLERGSLITFPATLDEGETLARAIGALVARAPLQSLRVTKVDGMDALSSPRAEALVKAGFVRDYRGLVLSQA
jgi:hypothetical protein